ncbi:MAG: carbon starvation protein A [Clostridium sp.]|nr:carbon starvation protein A [Bacteroides sp.]MCM1198581.1 carbon starvation protein A [Clostridium sp.]
MITFILCLAFLVAGYFLYGKYVQVTVGFDNALQTPANRLKDGIDYVPMPWYKAFLIQFLNIAGTGPIFGAILGAMFGPVAFLWITLGSVLAGAVHDYLSGVISMRHDGTSVSEIVGIYLGGGMRTLMRVFSVILLVLVGTVFVSSPAALLSSMTGISVIVWTVVIILYYIVATVLPIDKVIGKIYPLFGAALLVMAAGITVAMLIGHFNGSLKMMELNVENLHPKGLSVFPFLFVTIACGAISGFHATQSPMMARCVTKEGECRPVFFGAMIVEGIVALIWCAATIAFFGDTPSIGDAVASGGPATVVNSISKGLLGTFGSILAVLGVVACPITSGDTAFRSARLTLADATGIRQDSLGRRFLIAIPLFVICIVLTQVNFDVLWRYFAWSNQTLATIFLWTASAYLSVNSRNYWIALAPAVFMTCVVISYIMQAPEGLRLGAMVSDITAVLFSAASFIWFHHRRKR